MHEIGLYHPRIHFPSDAWVKAAALYWTKLARIVPPDYAPHDSDTVRALRDELDFVVNIRPLVAHRIAFTGACQEFLTFVANNHVELRKRYGVDEGRFPWRAEQPDEFPFGSESWDDERGEPLVAEVAAHKLAWLLRDALVEYGLAVATPRPVSLDSTSLLMHPDLARVYMSALAEDLARTNQLRPTTDDHDVFAVGTGWTGDRMRDLLLPRDEPEIPAVPRTPDRHTTPDLIGMIAIQAVIPAGLEHVPVRKIIKIRERFAAQFAAFRDTVDTVADDIGAQLDKVRDPAVARAYLEQEVRERLLTPANQLRHEMRQLKIDTAAATLTFKYEVPALASLAAGGALAHEPLLAGGAAVAVGLLSLARGARHKAAEDRNGSPVSYLLLLDDQLGAHATLRRAARQLRRVTGLG